ncbi:MAG TPA: A24 family peptidase C-terminal domain-containing protein [candidate division Zixibacteria bacterium]|nr:A24 family peptidase C-terminal domain-containing protein [candidate division Zixibacteria bacterium]
MLHIWKLLFFTPFLLYSCYSDIKTHRVTNNLLSIMLVSGVVFIVFDILTHGISYILYVFISGGLMFVIVYILFQLGIFGGADAKSLIVLSMIFPASPTFKAFEYSFPLHETSMDSFAFSILGNAIILIFIFLIGLAAYNIMKQGIRIDNPWYIFIGYKTKISQLVNKHVGLLQGSNIVDRDIELHYRRGELDDRIIHELKNLSEKGLIRDEVWVTPKLPFMIPMTMGFFVAVFYGDLATELTKYLISFFLK